MVLEPTLVSTYNVMVINFTLTTRVKVVVQQTSFSTEFFRDIIERAVRSFTPILYSYTYEWGSTYLYSA